MYNVHVSIHIDDYHDSYVKDMTYAEYDAFLTRLIDDKSIVFVVRYIDDYISISISN